VTTTLVRTQHNSCCEYEERLEKCKIELSQVTLDDLYENEKIVGNMMKEEYKPALMESGMSRAIRAMKLSITGSSSTTAATAAAETPSPQELVTESRWTFF
jgi:hypothetical protein